MLLGDGAVVAYNRCHVPHTETPRDFRARHRLRIPFHLFLARTLPGVLWLHNFMVVIPGTSN